MPVVAALGLGLHRGDDRVGSHATGDEHLRAVDQVAILHLPCSRGSGCLCDVGARVGLGDPQARGTRSPRIPGTEEPLLLFLAAEPGYRWQRDSGARPPSAAATPPEPQRAQPPRRTRHRRRRPRRRRTRAANFSPMYPSLASSTGRSRWETIKKAYFTQRCAGATPVLRTVVPRARNSSCSAVNGGMGRRGREALGRPPCRASADS